MKKITDLTETHWRTTYYRDAYGNRQKDREEYIAKRPVKSVAQGPRIGHFLIDFIIIQLIVGFINFMSEIFVASAQVSHSLSLTINFISSVFGLLFWLAFYIVCEHVWRRTPGKFITKTLVIDEYGNKPTLNAIILRTVIRLVPFELFSCFDDKYSYGWHDKWSKTWVVPDEELAELKRLLAEEDNME